MFDVRCSMFDVRCSMFDVRCSMLHDFVHIFHVPISNPYHCSVSADSCRSLATISSGDVMIRRPLCRAISSRWRIKSASDARSLWHLAARSLRTARICSISDIAFMVEECEWSEKLWNLNFVGRTQAVAKPCLAAHEIAGYSPACFWMSARCCGEMNSPAPTMASRGPRMLWKRPAFFAIKSRPSVPIILRRYALARTMIGDALKTSVMADGQQWQGRPPPLGTG